MQSSLHKILAGPLQHPFVVAYLIAAFSGVIVSSCGYIAFLATLESVPRKWPVSLYSRAGIPNFFAAQVLSLGLSWRIALLLLGLFPFALVFQDTELRTDVRDLFL